MLLKMIETPNHKKHRQKLRESMRFLEGCRCGHVLTDGRHARASQPRMLHSRHLVLPRLHPMQPQRLSAAWPVMAARSGTQGKVS